MRITKETIKAKYAELSTEQLIELYKGGELLEEARILLVNEIKKRGSELPSESEVRAFQVEKQAVSKKKKAAIWSIIGLGIILFLFRYGGYEIVSTVVLESLFPKKAAYIYLDKGLKFGKQGNHAKAVEYFQKARAINPKDPLVFIALGGAYMGLGRFKDAVSLYNRAIELDPSSGEAYAGLAAVYDLLGDYDKAALCVQKSIDLFEKGGDQSKIEKTKILFRQIYLDRQNTLRRN